jgi:chemotaxis protein MotB
MAVGDNQAPIIIKKVKKLSGHGHHGGAWKVAYADFVTAMMAFFLLLWLLAMTSEEQRQGIADYFAPTVISQSTTSGSGDILGGKTLTTEGSARDTRTPLGMIVTPSGEGARATAGEEDGAPRDSAAEAGDGPAEGAAAAAEDIDPEALDEAVAARESEDFEAIAQELRQAIAAVPELDALAENLLVDQTAEGLRIQIVDRQGTSMFASGSALPLAHTRTLLGLVADAVGKMPNRIAIKGHTDATPFRGEGNYTNWELSSDRAHASRRALLASGLPDQRVAYVVGKADQEPLDPGDPYAAVNRRISIVLLRDGMGDGMAPAQAPQPLAPRFEPPSLLQRGAAGAPAAGPAAKPAADPYANVLTFEAQQ